MLEGIVGTNVKPDMQEMSQCNAAPLRPVLQLVWRAKQHAVACIVNGSVSAVRSGQMLSPSLDVNEAAIRTVPQYSVLYEGTPYKNAFSGRRGELASRENVVAGWCC